MNKFSKLQREFNRNLNKSIDSNLNKNIVKGGIFGLLTLGSISLVVANPILGSSLLSWIGISKIREYKKKGVKK